MYAFIVSVTKAFFWSGSKHWKYFPEYRR